MKPVRRSASVRFVVAIAAAVIAFVTAGATADELSQLEVAPAVSTADGPRATAATESAKPQGLWIVSNLHTNNVAYISDIQGTWFRHSGRPKASVAFGGAANLGAPGGVAFDKARNLWATFCGGLVVELTPGELGRLANRERVKAKVVIGFSGYLACPTGLTFDQSGNLWIANAGYPFQSIIELPASSLGASTTTFTGLQIQSAALYHPINLKFDQAGNLWVVDTGEFYYSPGTIVRFTPDQLAAGGDLTPSLIVSLGDEVPQDIGFDHAGNLWTVANPPLEIASSQIQMYTAAELSGSGTITPTPAVTITRTLIPREEEWSLLCSDGMAFDAAGNLWVANSCTEFKFHLGSIVKFTPDQLTTSGAPMPSVFWTPNGQVNSFYEPSLLTFGPPLR